LRKKCSFPIVVACTGGAFSAVGLKLKTSEDQLYQLETSKISLPWRGRAALKSTPALREQNHALLGK